MIWSVLVFPTISSLLVELIPQVRQFPSHFDYDILIPIFVSALSSGFMLSEPPGIADHPADHGFTHHEMEIHWHWK
jgi:hypothetical protein